MCCSEYMWIKCVVKIKDCPCKPRSRAEWTTCEAAALLPLLRAAPPEVPVVWPARKEGDLGGLPRVTRHWKGKSRCSEEDGVTVFTVSVRDGEGIIYTLQGRNLGAKPGAHQPQSRVVFAEFPHDASPQRVRSWWWKPGFCFLRRGSSTVTAVLRNDVLAPRGKNRQRASGKCRGHLPLTSAVCGRAMSVWSHPLPVRMRDGTVSEEPVWGSLRKVEHGLIMWPTYPKPCKTLRQRTSFHCWLQHNHRSQRVVTTQTTGQWIKQSVVRTHNGTLFSCKKKTWTQAPKCRSSDILCSGR